MKTFKQHLRESRKKLAISDFDKYDEGSEPPFFGREKDTAGLRYVPKGRILYAIEAQSEDAAEALRDQFDHDFNYYAPFDGHRITSTNVMGPQRSNGFYKNWVFYVEVKK